MTNHLMTRLVLAFTLALAILAASAPSAAARPPPEACADAGTLEVTYRDLECEDGQVCWTWPETFPGACYDTKGILDPRN